MGNKNGLPAWVVVSAWGSFLLVGGFLARSLAEHLKKYDLTDLLVASLLVCALAYRLIAGTQESGSQRLSGGRRRNANKNKRLNK